MRERGLKCKKYSLTIDSTVVAPHAGAWIEIISTRTLRELRKVAPHAGAWIEITWLPCLRLLSGRSLPMRERGLKFHIHSYR